MAMASVAAMAMAMATHAGEETVGGGNGNYIEMVLTMVREV